MERKLTIEELSVYLPYGVKVYCTIDGSIGEVISVAKHQYVCKGKFDLNNGTENSEFIYVDFDNYINLASPKNFKPMLRPLSELSNCIDKEDCSWVDIMNRECFDGNDGMGIRLDSDLDFDLTYDRDEPPIYFSLMYSHEFFNWLVKNHFDVFSLIPDGLAIDINTLSND